MEMEGDADHCQSKYDLMEFLQLDMDSLLDFSDTEEQWPANSSSGLNPPVEANDADPSQLQPIPASAAEATTVQVQAGSASPEEALAGMSLSTTTELELQIAEMVRVATECCEDDDARTTWSQEEHELLIRCLDLYAQYDDVSQCFMIAFHLPNKTARDVALRWRWLQDKRKTATTSSAPAKLTKVKGKETKKTKITKISNKMYPLSKEALSSRSTKELLRDNNMFLKQIEDNLRTGQLANTSDYFYYVKTNMDSILERGSKFGVNMTMPPIDEQGLDEILQARLNSLSLTDDA